jgi:hypothetical protein
MDRFSGEPPQYTGGGDAREAAAVQNMMDGIYLKEIELNQFTYRFEDCRSRIDRIYSNMDRYEWMDRDIGCVALDWDDDTSRHRPIAAFKRSKD